MIIHDMPQGGLEWLEARLGIPTSSNFEKIVTPTGKLSTQSRAYAHYLVTEVLLQRQLDNIDNLEWIARGKEMEPQAVKMYEFQQECETRAVGFISTDDGMVGCSPDRLVLGASGGVEIKCPAPHTHVGYMVDGRGDKYKPQTQGQMLVAEFDFVDFWSYHPELPPVLERTYRDEQYIATLSKALNQFNDMRLEMLEKVRAKGFIAERKHILTTHAEAYPAEYEDAY
jgi:hypothetical protein